MLDKNTSAYLTYLAQKLFSDCVIDEENKYRLLFENMVDVVCMIDSEKRIIDINPSGLEFFGYTKEEMLQISLDDIIYHEDKDISDQYFDQLDQTGSYTMYEGRVRTKSGAIKWIQVNSTEFFNGDEKIGSQDIIRDISKRKEIELELEQTVRKLHELIATKDKLFSIIAHDLRSPFTSILGLSELALEDVRNSDYEGIQTLLENINTSAQSTFNLLENLLSWAKSQTGKLIINKEHLYIHETVNEVCELFLSASAEKHISILIPIDPKLEIISDKNLIMTILRNLISNALKFTLENGIIEITATANNGQTIIAVRDNGLGMNENTLSTLFDLKKEKISWGTSNESGSGLGLILCKELIEKLGGAMGVESSQGKGSVFSLIL